MSKKKRDYFKINLYFRDGSFKSYNNCDLEYGDYDYTIYDYDNGLEIVIPISIIKYIECGMY